jgi:thymidylate kinase
VKKTNLILIEGLPGSGKSTTAQFVSNCISDSGIENKWWYEEEEGHPIYLFNDKKSMRNTVDELSRGSYKEIIKHALEQWKAFAQMVQNTQKVIVVDSTFFGYLTWTLFPMDVPIKEIRSYLIDVEEIIKPCNPALIYLYQDNIGTSLKKICERRGGNTADRFIRNATESTYGKRKKLIGFDGMVSFWTDYRDFTDQIFAQIKIDKLAIENSASKWEEYMDQITSFLDLPVPVKVDAYMESMDCFVGIYSNSKETCQIYRDGDDLYLNGISRIWPKSRLIPSGRTKFVIESLPINVQFTLNRIFISGPRLFDGEVNLTLTKSER